jgi:hypothetical protein
MLLIVPTPGKRSSAGVGGSDKESGHIATQRLPRPFAASTRIPGCRGAGRGRAPALARRYASPAPSPRSSKGFFVMNDNWFDEYVFEIAAKRSELPPELQEALDQEPIVLPAWDPMGALAKIDNR